MKGEELTPQKVKGLKVEIDKKKNMRKALIEQENDVLLLLIEFLFSSMIQD